MGTEGYEKDLRIITEEENNRTEPADNSQRRHSLIHLHFIFFLLFLWDLYFPGLSSPTHTHTHIQSPAELQALLNFLPQVKR